MNGVFQTLVLAGLLLLIVLVAVATLLFARRSRQSNATRILPAATDRDWPAGRRH